ncbi:DNA methyltransferase, partial [Arthrobacter sp. FW306-06-A]|uniref:DNA methyltransferase n=1 Tax=Arthrobacter sp. FW306-06-A TaxID=2879621 RepID=UPI002351A564
GRTVIRGDLWKGFHQDMGNVSREGGVAFNNGKKPVRLIKQLIRWANNNPDAVILDFFGGSGTTAHAVIDMNSDDGGHRQCILITNNEVSRKDDSQLRRRGLEPGDEEYEAQGVFHGVTKPRLEKVLEAVEDQSAVFLEVTYEDENLVALGRKFEAVAPLIWLKAGGTGEIIDKIDPTGLSAPTDATYAIIFDTDAAGLAIEALHAGIHRVFIVTDSEADFRTIVAALPSRLQDTAERLYSSYLRSFEINRG